ncbi:hypothetical protein FEM48_ZijujUnG0034300 [Ziziphus jujuba var. spinosa]|uniref:Uncharacterized protein n=1 Tax=Ziziphus jujuba var. spinosa TaxID=714518 RepID=A0A978U9F8_ZIZJJ|nr:hypothetical protein FEM48_ZijujUnG0034300 [Ziziphus jujuba var. spinosa]
MADLQSALDTCPALDSLKKTMDSNCEGNLKDFYAAMLHQARISNFDPQILEPGHISGPSGSKIARKEIPPTLLKRAAQALSEHPFRKSPRVLEVLEDLEPISFESFQGSAGTQEEGPQEPREESPNTPSTQITTAIFEEIPFSQGSYEAISGRDKTPKLIQGADESQVQRVAELLNPHTLSWDEMKLQAMCDQDSYVAIKNVKCRGPNVEDKLAMAQYGARVVVPIDLKKKPWEQKLPLHNRWHPDIPPVTEATD